jgi:predicted nucleotidyltransferase
VYAHAVEGADRALASALSDALEPSPTGLTVTTPNGTDVLSRLGVDQDSIDTFCRRNGVRRLAVFGSALRDDFTADSDVDLLVEFEPGRSVTLFDMAAMEMELETLVVGRRVDLRTAGDLSARFRDEVVAQAEPVYDVAA